MTPIHTRLVGRWIVKGSASAACGYDAAGLPQLFAGGAAIIPHSDALSSLGRPTERELFTTPDQTDAQLDDVNCAGACCGARLTPACAVITRWADVCARAASSRGPMRGGLPD